MGLPGTSTQTQRMPNKLPTRFDLSIQHIKTNFTVGNVDDPLGRSVYYRDFGSADPSKQDATLPPLTATCKGMNGDQQLGQHQQEPSKKSGKSKSQRNNFTFGDESLSFSTVYADDYRYQDAHAHSWRQGVEPQSPAQVLPLGTANLPRRGSLDYNHFGSGVSGGIYSNRLSELSDIKATHTRDSVALSQIGKTRKMMTRAMIDYQRPLERLHGNVKLVMLQRISPRVRQDSIWQSVNNGGASHQVSEAQQAFRWPLAAAGLSQRHFRSGHVTTQ